MKVTPLILGSLAAALIIGCGDGRRDSSGTTSGSESGTMQDTGSTGAATDTSMTGNTGTSGTDTSAGATSGTPSAKGNQTESGVTDTRTGESTLGEGVAKTRPDQNQPTTSKGDTIRSGGDSAGGSPQ